MALKDGFFKESGLRQIAGVAAMAVMLAGSASATAPAVVKSATAHAVTTPAERCAALEKQFDTAIAKDPGGRNLIGAKRLRAEGGHLCELGRHAAGALRLSKALADLGLEPQEP